MLTGDKAITARMIGIQCGLIKIDSTLIRLKENSNLDEIKNEIKQALLTIENSKHFQLMVEGSTMAIIINNFWTVTGVKELLLNADSVILYRSSPS